MAVALSTIKENIQSIFEAANTTTASFDLSTGLSDRVIKIVKINPAKIPIQPSWFPYVTIYVDGKTVEHTSIAATQLAAQRRAEIDFKIVGALWNSSHVTTDEDDADNDCEALMENIEEVMRRNYTISNSVLWCQTTDVTYHSLPIDEEAHLRAGILNLRATILY